MNALKLKEDSDRDLVSNDGNYRVIQVAGVTRRKRWLPQYKQEDGTWQSISSCRNGIDCGMFRTRAVANVQRHAAAAEAHGETPAQSGRKYV